MKWHVTVKLASLAAAALIGAAVDAGILHREVGDALVALARALAGQFGLS